MAALDNGVCHVAGCTVHTGWARGTPVSRRNDQIREDWRSGYWSVDELSSFWELKPLLVSSIVKNVEKRALPAS